MTESLEPRPRRTLSNLFSRVACKASYYSSRPAAFISSCTIVVLWLISGPLFDWGTTWQLLINTGTTIVTFLMIFLLQHAQAHDTTAMHLKLDEIIRAVKGAHNDAIEFEKMDEDELLARQRYYYALAEQARKAAMEDSAPRKQARR